MTRKEARELADKHSFRETFTNRYITPRRVVYIIIDSLLGDAESVQKENTRLKKQLANNHHIECMCSFCKPAVESNININKAIITLNNALYFRDNSDYQTALFDALSELTGIKYNDFPNEFMEEK